MNISTTTTTTFKTERTMRIKEPQNEGSFEHSIVIKTDDAIMAVASEMLTRKSSLLKKYDLSLQQYTILRTLNFAKGEPASIKSLTEEMIDKMSNTSRLVAKLEKKGFLKRKISVSDRRQVEVIITKAGEAIFKKSSAELNLTILSAYKPLCKAGLTILLEALLKLKETPLT